MMRGWLACLALRMAALLPDQDASLGMRRAKSLRKKMNEVDSFAAARDLPDDLRTALADYYNDAWMAHEGKPGPHLITIEPESLLQSTHLL